jgi:hypothetical protein
VVVDQGQGLGIGRLGLVKSLRTHQAVLDQHDGQARELVHRKAMPGRHFGAEGGMVDDRRHG